MKDKNYKETLDINFTSAETFSTEIVLHCVLIRRYFRLSD